MASHNNQAAQQAILASLIYSDIFDFPLTKEELWQFLLSKAKISRQEFENTLTQLTCHSREQLEKDTPRSSREVPIVKRRMIPAPIVEKLTQKNGYFCLKGREKIIAFRQNHIQDVKKKNVIAKRAAFYLSYIPSIQLIGISGGLALGNVTETDDIDFFIITQKGTLWTTRIWILALLEALNLRRKRTDQQAANKICCNLIIEKSKIAWPKDKQNIYSAHEIIQLKPLFERGNTYQDFLVANRWTEQYIPNFIPINPRVKELPYNYWYREYYILKLLQFIGNLEPLKKTLKFLQEKRMQKHRTRETIKKDFLALHPHDYAAETTYLFNKKLKKYGLLTNI